MTTLAVFDLNMASAYYACVFDTEVVGSDADDEREMRVGSKWYRLKKAKGAAPPHDPHVAEVEDADVCVARAAAKGGRIIDPVADGPDQRRSGAMQDPFGFSWRVCNRS